VEAAQRGEVRAFDALVRRFRPRIYALALHLSGSPSDADDITQEAFLQAYRHIGSFKGRSEFFTWLYRITMNRAFNVRRGQVRRGAGVPLDDPRIEAALEADAGKDPRRQLELRETYTQLVHAMDALSPTLKGAVVLTQLQGLSQREAAVILETSEGAIAWRLHEARKRLRRELERANDTSGVVRTRRPTKDKGVSLELALALAATR